MTCIYFTIINNTDTEFFAVPASTNRWHGPITSINANGTNNVSAFISPWGPFNTPSNPDWTGGMTFISNNQGMLAGPGDNTIQVAIASEGPTTGASIISGSLEDPYYCTVTGITKYTNSGCNYQATINIY